MTLEELSAKVEQLVTDNSELKGQIIDLSKEKEKIIGNRDEILAEKRDAKAAMDALKAEIEELKGRTAPGEKPPKEDEGKKTVATLQAELAEMRKELADEKATKLKTEIDADIKATLEGAGIKGPLASAALAMLKTQNEFAKGDSGVTMNGLPVADALKKWVDEGDGKSFIVNPASNGATPKAPNGSPVPQKSRSEMSPSEKGAYIAKNGLEAFEALPRA